MKALLVLLGTLIYSCGAEKEVQASMVDVQLVKIDTVDRYPNHEQKLLTWRDENNINYITFEPMNNHYKLGDLMKVMVRK